MKIDRINTAFSGQYFSRKFCVFFLLLVVGCSLTECKLFTQPYRLRELFYREEVVVTILENVIDQDPEMPLIQDYLQRFQSRRNEVPILLNLAQEERHLDIIMEHLVGNPIHVYSLVYRLVKGLKLARQELVNHPRLGGLERVIYSIIRDTEYPDEQDLEGVAISLARVQFTYRLDPLKMAKGLISGIETSGRLSTMEMLDIATRRISGAFPIRPGVYKEYALAYEWAEAALNTIPDLDLIPESKNNLTGAIQAFLITVQKDHDLRFNSMEMSPGNLPNEEFFITKIGDNIKPGRLGFELRKKEIKALEKRIRLEESVPGSYNLHDFYDLCRGDRIPVLSKKKEKEQKCYLTNVNEARFIINPLKMEVLSENPPVAVFHEILSQKDISSMKHYVSNQLNAAEIQDVSKADGKGAKVTTERTQSSGWLWEHQFPFLYNLSNLLEKITKLKVARPENKRIDNIVEAEAWQVGVYGPGGHYLPHYDSFDILDPSSYTPEGVWVGNRMSTVMFYLSDVVGGATAFPSLGVAARPRAGSMVFWHNLKQSGEREMMSLHGACPTALGIKWVSNKWIREGAQVFQRPCALAISI